MAGEPDTECTTGVDSNDQLLIQLIADHHESLFRYAYCLARSAEDAEDLTQHTFLIAHQKIHQVREQAAVRSWLFTVLRRSFLRMKSKQRLSVVSLPPDDEVSRPTATKVDEIDHERLKMALDQLPEPFRIVVLMFYFEELSYKQIAEQLDIPLGTVMSRLSRAKTHIRQFLQTPNSNTTSVAADAR